MIEKHFDELLLSMEVNEMLTDEQLIEFLQVSPLQEISLKAVEKFQLEFLNKREAFFDYALRMHKRLFVRVAGIGYKILQPDKQADYTIEKLDRKLSSAIRKAELRLMNIDRSALSHDDRRRAVDIAAHIAHMKTVLKSR